MVANTRRRTRARRVVTRPAPVRLPDGTTMIPRWDWSPWYRAETLRHFRRLNDPHCFLLFEELAVLRSTPQAAYVETRNGRRVPEHRTWVRE